MLHTSKKLNEFNLTAKRYNSNLILSLNMEGYHSTQEKSQILIGFLKEKKIKPGL